MARRKQDELTPRQRQSRKIMREKEKFVKRQQIVRRIQLAVLAFSIIIIGGGGFWSWKSGAFMRGVNSVTDKIYGVTAKSGYYVQTLYLEGRNRTPMNDIDEALNINKGAPILQISLDDVRQRLEKIESIKAAAVERSLPDTLYVRIVEREPVALWQHQGKISLVDDNGVAMNGLDSTPYQSLPLIVGDDAPKHVQELLEILATQPELTKRFSAAQWVGERRWNIRLHPVSGADNAEDIEVRLPENQPLKAWKKLAKLQSDQKLLDRDVKVIDLRIDGRLFIKLPPEEIHKPTTNAKDT